MSESIENTEFLIIGAGPAGQKAAIQAAKAGRSVILVEREQKPGGACVTRGTIPSKTLHETASAFLRIGRVNPDIFSSENARRLPMQSMMARVNEVVEAHQAFMSDQLARNTIEFIHGRASFTSPSTVRVESPGRRIRNISAEYIIIATGSKPRDPDDIVIDHENILDSDSILSLAYLPKSLTVLGGGVIASEYASIFAGLGVEVFQVDRYPTPLGFMAPELVERFTRSFAKSGGEFVGNSTIKSVEFDGVSAVNTTLECGRVITTEKLLFALGRVANLAGLAVEKAGLEITDRGLLTVDGNCATAVKHIYAVGDVIGPPGLAASAMEQGRRAARAILELETNDFAELIPIGIYAIPELASVGLSEKAAIAKYGSCMVGSAEFSELARGQISGNTEGLLRLIVDEFGEKILGVEAIGESATELMHMGQVALISGWAVDAFIENIFNFPTMAEAYRVAALDIMGQRIKKASLVTC